MGSNLSKLAFQGVLIEHLELGLIWSVSLILIMSFGSLTCVELTFLFFTMYRVVLSNEQNSMVRKTCFKQGLLYLHEVFISGCRVERHLV